MRSIYKKRISLMMAMMLTVQLLGGILYADNVVGNVGEDEEKAYASEGAAVTSGAATLIKAAEDEEKAYASEDTAVTSGAATFVKADESAPYTLTSGDVTMSGDTITAFVGDIAITGTNIIIPSTIGGVSVRKIGKNAFQKKGLTRVTIPDGVTELGEEAFGRNELVSVEIPDSVTKMGKAAFCYNQLTSVEIPSNVTTLSDFIFTDNQLTNIEIPNGVTSIGGYAFRRNKLTSLTIHNSVTIIGASAFLNNQLSSLEIPNSVTRIGDSAFRNNQLRNLVIPNSVTEIGAQAFFSSRLLSVEIPSSVAKVGAEAFRYNPILMATIPGDAQYGVASDGAGIFSNTDLRELKISDGSLTGEELVEIASRKVYLEDTSLVEDDEIVIAGEIVYPVRHKVTFLMGDTTEIRYVLRKLNNHLNYQVDHGSIEKPPTPPIIEGKRFIGWDSDDYLYVREDPIITAQYVDIQ